MLCQCYFVVVLFRGCQTGDWHVTGVHPFTCPEDINLSMKDILQLIQVHIPFRLLKGEFLDMVIEKGIHPEISFDHNILDVNRTADYKNVARRFHDAGRTVTFHAPFLDLRPGSLDPRIRDVTLLRLRQIFGIALIFRPRMVVCHPSFDIRYYITAEEMWLHNSIATWRRVLELADQADTVIAFENVYEENPEELGLLFDALDSRRIRLCFDTGHFNVYSRTPLNDWMDRLGTFMGEVHIHDNKGEKDEHLPIGEGTFPFRRFFDAMRDCGARAVFTVEAHSEEDLWVFVRNLEAWREHLVDLIQDL